MMVEDLRAVLRLAAQRDLTPSAVVLDSRTIRSTPESCGRAGFDGAKKRKGSKVHVAVDTLDHWLALKVTPANQQDREQVEALAQGVQQVTGSPVELAYVDQGYTGENAAERAKEHGIRLEVVKLPKRKKGKKQFVLLPKRWVVERSFAWAARLRRLARVYERLSTTLASYHWLAFALLMLKKLRRHKCMTRSSDVGRRRLYQGLLMPQTACSHPRDCTSALSPKTGDATAPARTGHLLS